MEAIKERLSAIENVEKRLSSIESLLQRILAGEPPSFAQPAQIVRGGDSPTPPARKRSSGTEPAEESENSRSDDGSEDDSADEDGPSEEEVCPYVALKGQDELIFPVNTVNIASVMQLTPGICITRSDHPVHCIYEATKISNRPRGRCVAALWAVRSLAGLQGSRLRVRVLSLVSNSFPS